MDHHSRVKHKRLNQCSLPSQILSFLVFSFTSFNVVVIFIFTGLCQGNDQRFIDEPKDAVAFRGQVLQFRCQVENQVGQVQWLRDGFGLGPGPEFEGFPRYKVQQNPPLGEYTLMVSNISLEDDAYFQCQVGATETTRGLQSRRAKLTVLLPPDSLTIDNGPVVEVKVNASYNLTCRASHGKPAPSITWDSSSFNISDNATEVITILPDGKRQDIASTLVIYPQKFHQGWSYQCQANSIALLEPLLTKVTLEVIYPPEIEISLKPGGQIREYDTVTITCAVSANPAVATWRWFLGSELISGQSTAVLVLPSISRKLHLKSVTCDATNKAGSSHQSLSLDISYGPVFLSPDDVAADPGDSVKMSCVTESNPPSAVVWRKMGHMEVLGSDSTLSFSSITEDDFGTYTCTASVLGFEDASQNIQLIKKGPPTIKSSPEQSARYGEVGALNCEIRAIPKPTTVSWSKENKPLDLKTQTRYKVREEDTKQGWISILEISDVQDKDFGAYNCTADNGYGQAHLEITFSKKAMLPLSYILAAVLSGVLLIIIVLIAIFVYRRRKSYGSEKGSESSEYNITKHKDTTPDIKVEYTNGAVLSAPQHGSTGGLRNVNGDDSRHHSRYYSPAQYTAPDPWIKSRYVAPAATHDPVTNDAPYLQADIYGTYPRRPRNDNPYRDQFYTSNMYGTIRGRPPTQPTRPYEVIPPMASPAGSRLSTNV